jgi:hypothetical protein
MKIAALEKYRGRNPKGYFKDLPREIRFAAYWWLERFLTRWERDMPPWRFAILVGQAKRLAINPPTSAWGKSMLAKRGGLAVQRKYRLVKLGTQRKKRLGCDWPSNSGKRPVTSPGSRARAESYICPSGIDGIDIELMPV